MINFTDYPLAAIFSVSIVALLTASEIGHGLGLRAAGEANISALEAGMLGLLALMLGFTFAMALTRFDERRDAVLHEANAIGTAALRSRLLPAPHAAENMKLLYSYVQVRLDITKRVLTPAELSVAIARSNEIQAALWRQAKLAMARDNSMVPTGLYIQALNETFDNQEKHLTALRSRVPDIVLLALYSIAAVAIGFTGYASGTEQRRWRFPVYVMSIVVAGVILLIQDIDRPGAGFVTVSQQPMIDTASALASFLAEIKDSTPQQPK
jgi:hypothetical protein